MPYCCAGAVNYLTAAGRIVISYYAYCQKEEHMAELREEYRRKNTFWRNWGAVIILAVFFVTSLGGKLQPLRLPVFECRAHKLRLKVAHFELLTMLFGLLFFDG